MENTSAVEELNAATSAINASAIAEAIARDGQTHLVEMIIRFDKGVDNVIFAVKNGIVVDVDDPRCQWIVNKKYPDDNPRPVRFLEVIAWYKKQKYVRETQEPKPMELVAVRTFGANDAS